MGRSPLHNDRVLLVEYNDSHHETLYPQVFLLEASGCEVWIVVRDQDVAWLQETLPGRNIMALPSRGLCYRWRTVWKVLRWQRTHRIGRIVINTLTSVMARRLVVALFLRPHVQLAAVLHGTNRLRHRGSQRIIGRRLRHYWVLSEHQHHHLPPGSEKYQIGTYWPITLVDPRLADATTTVSSNEYLSPGINVPRVWAIPGHPSRARRDYTALFDALDSARPDPGRLQFWLLGDFTKQDGPALLAEIESRDLTDYFRWTTTRLPFPIYHALIAKCEAILPLIHPGVHGYHKYQTRKTSGNFNLALGLQKPILLPNGFAVDSILEELTVRYSIDQFSSLIENRPIHLELNQPLENSLSLEEVRVLYMQLWEMER